MLLEGRANQFTISMEGKFKDMIITFKNEIDIRESEKRVKQK